MSWNTPAHSVVRRHPCAYGIVLLTATLVAQPGSRGHAAAAEVIFQVDQANSPLTIQATARGLTSDDTQLLAGTINAIIDLGSSGAFPEVAELTLTGSTVSPVADFDIRLGLWPIFGVRALASGLVAEVATTSPPGSMARLAGPGQVYEFDASTMTFAINQGTVTVSGLFSSVVDLGATPVAGSPSAGVMGTLTLTTGDIVGPYTRVNAEMMLPIDIAQTVQFGEENPENVDLVLTGAVAASSSFYVALEPIPGDFNGDASVSDDDLPLWFVGFGMAEGAAVGDGDANADGAADGRDFLVWQRNLGTQPPAIAGASAVPEPATAMAGLTALVAALAAASRRRRFGR